MTTTKKTGDAPQAVATSPEMIASTNPDSATIITTTPPAEPLAAKRVTRAVQPTAGQLANLRAHAEQGSLDGVKSYVDCAIMVSLLDAREERDELRRKLDDTTAALLAACALAEKLNGDDELRAQAADLIGQLRNVGR